MVIKTTLNTAPLESARKARGQRFENRIEGEAQEIQSMSISSSIRLRLIKRLRKINLDLTKIPAQKKRDVFVKVSLEQSFGPQFVLSSQYEEIHQKVLSQLGRSKKTAALDALLKKLM